MACIACAMVVYLKLNPASSARVGFTCCPSSTTVAPSPSSACSSARRGCPGQRACPHAQLGIPETAHGPTLEYHQLAHGRSTRSLTCSANSGTGSHEGRDTADPSAEHISPMRTGAGAVALYTPCAPPPTAMRRDCEH
jgi:hypothetical protein